MSVYDLISELFNFSDNQFKKKELLDKAKHIICISNFTKLEFVWLITSQVKLLILWREKTKVVQKKYSNIYIPYTLLLNPVHTSHQCLNKVKFFLKRKFWKPSWNCFLFVFSLFLPWYKNLHQKIISFNLFHGRKTWIKIFSDLCTHK